MHPIRIASLSLFASLLSLTAPLFAAETSSPLMIAHRGAGFEFDENTVGACRYSYEMGIRGFEVDIRLTRDNQLVLMHDDQVNRTTGGNGVVENMTLAEVTALRTKKNNDPVPSAADLFTYFKDKPDVFIELEMKTSNKNAYPEDRLEVYCRLLHEGASALPAGTYVFTSFDRRALSVMKRLYPDATTMLITSEPPAPGLIEEVKKLGCSRMAIVMDVTSRKFIRDAQKAGLKVAGWPTRSEADHKLALALGVDTFTTDVPSQLLGKKPATP